MIKKLKWIKRLKQDLKRKRRIIEMQHSRIETLEWDLRETQAELVRREREMIECTKRVVDMAAKIEKDRTEEEAEGFKGETKNLERIHRIIEHIMDSS